MATEETLDLAATGLQAFTMQKLHRSQLRGAPYNPRQMSDAARRKLKTGLEKHGLVAPVTFNKRTGNLVGGHQRLSQLDALAGTENYKLDVAVIEVDEVREKELNLLLNNMEAMGDFDLDLLQSVLRTEGLDLDATGFDHADIYQLFGDSALLDHGDALDEFAERVRQMRDTYDKVKSGQSNRNSPDFYLVVVFKDEGKRDEFVNRFALPDNRYQSGEQLTELCLAADNFRKAT